MSNFDTRFINFLTVIFLLGLMSGFSGCGSEPNSKFSPQQNAQIVGGENVDENSRLANKVIYLALGVERKNTPNGFTISQKSICTATAIRKNILLTAAHCVKDMPKDQVYAVLSLNPWNHALNMDEWVIAKNIAVHQKYVKTKEASEHDLALIQLSKDLPADKVSNLADAAVLPVPLIPIVSVGYGESSVLLEPNDQIEVQAKESMLNMVDRMVENYSVNNNLFSINQNDHKGICHGDSGGPALFYDVPSDRYLVLGVASFISIFEHEKQKLDPQNKMNLCMGRGTYTNVLPYLTWINETIDQLSKIR